MLLRSIRNTANFHIVQRDIYAAAIRTHIRLCHYDGFTVRRHRHIEIIA